MAPAYKLHYFDARIRGELIRWVLSYGGQEFEDVRVKPENWPALKASTPTGQVLSTLFFSASQFFIFKHFFYDSSNYLSFISY